MEAVRSDNWLGSIPSVITLAISSLSSPTMPEPIHVMIPRQSFLHLALQSTVQRLHKFAPALNATSSVEMVRGTEPDIYEDSHTDKDNIIENSTDNLEEYPICWFEDADSELPLRWHFFAGILWDSNCISKSLPWKIRVHFIQYPSSQIIPMECSPLISVERTFKNSIKQALFLQYGTSKAAMNLSKQSHEKLWKSILSVNYALYHEVNDQLQSTSPKLLPVRLLIDSKPAIQKPIAHDTIGTLGALLALWAPSIFKTSENGGVEPTTKDVRWKVQGIQVPLSMDINMLWLSLCHPDQFLYVVVNSK
jgi:autophagy-related protein 5